MRLIYKYSLIYTLCIGLSSCVNSIDTGTAINLGVSAIRALTISNEEVSYYADLACQKIDAKSVVLPENNTYTQRLKRIANSLNTTIQGRSLNLRVYRDNELNAFAMANGCVRTYTATMDLLDDDELRAVLAHEIGHVGLEHTKNNFRLLSTLQVGLSTASGLSSEGVARVVSSPIFQNIIGNVVNAQFSQKQELEADNFSIDLLLKNGRDPRVLISALYKISKKSGKNTKQSGFSSILASHPDIYSRKQNMENKLGYLK